MKRREFLKLGGVVGAGASFMNALRNIFGDGFVDELVKKEELKGRRPVSYPLMDGLPKINAKEVAQIIKK